MQPPQQDPGTRLAVRAWNMMGGLDWTALPTVAEILGVEDVELLIHRLIAIREFTHRE